MVRELTPEGIAVLRALKDGVPPRSGDIAKATNLPWAVVAQCLIAAKKYGHVNLAPGAWTLTDKGRAILAASPKVTP